MAIKGIIRAAGAEPLGDAQAVKTRLAQAFPGLQFVLTTGAAQPFSLAALVSRTQAERAPYWEGMFEGKRFIVSFQVDEGPAVAAIRFTLFGAKLALLAPYFEVLRQATGWTVEPF